MSNDLRTVPTASRSLLLNSEMLRINQDALGRQGRRVRVDGGPWPHPSLQIWARDLSNGDVAVALYNFNSPPAATRVSFDEVGFSSVTQVQLYDVFGLKKDLGTH